MQQTLQKNDDSNLCTSLFSTEAHILPILSGSRSAPETKVFDYQFNFSCPAYSGISLYDRQSILSSTTEDWSHLGHIQKASLIGTIVDRPDFEFVRYLAAPGKIGVPSQQVPSEDRVCKNYLRTSQVCPSATSRKESLTPDSKPASTSSGRTEWKRTSRQQLTYYSACIRAW